MASESLVLAVLFWRYNKINKTCLNDNRAADSMAASMQQHKSIRIGRPSPVELAAATHAHVYQDVLA